MTTDRTGTGGQMMGKGSGVELARGRIAEAVLPGLLEMVHDAVLVVDEDGQIVLVNAATERLFGYSREELLGQPVETLVPAPLAERHPAHRAVYLAHPRQRTMGETLDLRAARKDGSLVTIEVTLTPVEDAAGKFVVCVVRDATERQRASEALQASETRFRILADQATDGIFLSDLAGQYVAVNDAACGMLGYSREELLCMSISDIIAPDEVARLPLEISRLTNGTTVTSEWRFRRRDGSLFEGEVNTRMLQGERMLAVLRDVSERKEREAEQLRSQRFIEAVAKASPSWIYVFDIDDMALRYMNRSILRDLGYPPELQQLTRFEDFTRFFPPDELSRLPQLFAGWRRLADDEVNEGEYRIRHADGTYRWLMGRATVFARHADGSVQQVLGTLDDITERKQAHEALRQSEEQFRTLIEDLDVGVLLQDAIDDRILLSNRAAQAMLGLPAAELRGLSSRDWPWRLLKEDGTDFARDDRPSVVAARTARPVSAIVGALNTSTGRCRWLQVTAVPRHPSDDRVRQVLVTMTDVTGRKAAEDALIAAREEWEHSFDALTDWVSVLDRDGRVVRANRTMRERFESQHGSVVGLHHLAIYESEGGGGEDPCASVLAGGSPVEFTTTLRHVPGHFAISCYPLREGRGAVHVVRDITQQRKLEEQLRQSQKMQALGQLAGGVAHDFNNLLTVIISCSDLAQMDLSSNPAAVSESIIEIREAADRAAMLTRQLLSFGRKGVWEEQVVSLNDIVRRVETMLRRLLAEDVEISTALSPSLLPTRADQGQLEQVILNLALNARDAMPEGGRLTIETGNVVFDEADCRADPARRPGRFVELTVRDTGVGMSSDVRAHLFEPFFTTKGLGKGTGLGLPTVYGIAQQAGGFITVESDVGLGSAFHVFFPAAVPQATNALVTETTDHRPAGNEAVLVVEDEADVRRAIVRSLLSLGFRVLDVRSADQAIEVLERHRGQISLLVTDVVMPGGSGPELAERAHARHPNLPVLFISGYSPEATPRVATGGAFLQKPFTSQDLARKIREVLDKRR